MAESVSWVHLTGCAHLSMVRTVIDWSLAYDRAVRAARTSGIPVSVVDRLTAQAGYPPTPAEVSASWARDCARAEAALARHPRLLAEYTSISEEPTHA
jgi:hypothetical protein